MISFQKHSNISLQGFPNFGTVLCCPPGQQSGLTFTDVMYLTIINITFVSCGALRVSTTLDTTSGNSSLLFLVSIYMLNYKHLTVTQVRLINSNGTGIALFDVTGHIKLAKTPPSDVTISESGMSLVEEECTWS